MLNRARYQVEGGILCLFYISLSLEFELYLALVKYVSFLATRPERWSARSRVQLGAVLCRFLMVQNPSKHAKAWEELRSCHGVLVPGGFGSRGLEGKIQAIKYAR